MAKANPRRWRLMDLLDCPACGEDVEIYNLGGPSDACDGDPVRCDGGHVGVLEVFAGEWAIRAKRDNQPATPGEED